LTGKSGNFADDPQEKHIQNEMLPDFATTINFRKIPNLPFLV
jgi:hypothetical protein